MSGQLIGIKAFFSLPGGEATGLVVYEDEQRVLRAAAKHTSGPSRYFPNAETIERGGMVESSALSLLERSILEVCDHDWLHRYGEVTWSDASKWDGRWRVSLQYSNGTIRRWQGVRSAPGGIDKVYEAFVEFGMPRLYLGDYCSYGLHMESKASGDLYLRLLGYLVDICRAVGDEAGKGRDDTELALLANDFCEDMCQAAKWPLDEEFLLNTLNAWGVPVSLEGLCEADVKEASRAQMYSLLWAFSRTPNVGDCAERLADAGAFNTWRERMVRIPYDEREEKRRLNQEELARVSSRIEEDIERRMATRRPFTSYEVARATASTARQASVVIRRFVRSGALEGVARTSPKQYVLSSSITRRREELPQAS